MDDLLISSDAYHGGMYATDRAALAAAAASQLGIPCSVISITESASPNLKPPRPAQPASFRPASTG